MNKNISKIKYLLVTDKVYKVTDINFHKLTLKASKTDLFTVNVSENEVFAIEMFSEFKIRLHNGGGMGDIIDFAEWEKRNRRDD